MSHLRQPVIIGFYGYSQSGKTTLISTIIYNLKMKGISIGVVKITDKPISSEPDNKDTQLFRQSGANITAFSSSIETGFVLDHSMSIQDVLKSIPYLSEVDIVIIEGAYSESVPKIRIGDIPLRPNTLFTFSGNIEEIEKTILEKLKIIEGNLNEDYD